MINYPKPPSSSEAIKIISELNSTDWLEFDGLNLDSYLKKMEDNIMNACGFSLNYILETNEIVNFLPFIFRVRRSDDVKNVILKSEYSYPPACMANKNLRANLISNPVFYGSLDIGTALLEYIQQWDNNEYLEHEYFVSCWNFNSNFTYKYVPFLPTTETDKNVFSIGSKHIFDNFKFKLPQGYNLDNISALESIFNYFTSTFKADNKRQLSSYLAHQYIYNDLIMPIFIYPSIKTDGRSSNIAIYPNFVDEYLNLVSIIKVKVNRIVRPNNRLEINIEPTGKFAINSNSRIEWKDKRIDTAYFNYVCKYFFPDGKFISEEK